MKKNILKNNGVQSLLASLVCVILGLLIGFLLSTPTAPAKPSPTL